MVALGNRLTGEVIVRTPGALLPAPGLHRLEASEPARAPWKAATASGLYVTSTSRPAAVVRTQLITEATSGDTIVTQTGRCATSGVWGVSWSLGDVPHGIDVLVPGNSGQRFGADSPYERREFDYPMGWEAGFVLLQGKRGGVAIRAEDLDPRRPAFKRLVVQHVTGGYRLRFTSMNHAPFDRLTEVRSVRWRISAYRGRWQDAAERYRQWYAARQGLVPLDRREPEWVRHITFVAHVGMEIPVIEELARRVDPRKTLLYVPGWRKFEYDRMYPDYTPSTPFAPFLARAKALGFRVMVHVNYFGVDPKHPLYAQFGRYQMRDPFTRELLWWDWDRVEPPIKFAYINPASAAWRKEFVGRMADLCRGMPIDALHLDQTLCLYNDNNGLVDGMDCMQGSIALHRQLKEALPQVAISGEGLDEITCRYEAFAQRHVWGLDHSNGTWNDRQIAASHPISSAVLRPYTTIYGYLGMCNPVTGPELYAAWRRAYENFDVIPTYPWPDLSQLGGAGKPPQPRAEQVLRTARWWQANEPRADYRAPWGADDLLVYRLLNGERAAYSRRQGVALVQVDRSGRTRVLSRRIECVERTDLGGSIPGWPAYHGGAAFGLNPLQVYDWSPDPPDASALHLSALPAGWVLASAGRHPDLLRYRIARSPRSAQAGTVRLLEYSGKAVCGVDLADGRRVEQQGMAFMDPDTGGAGNPEATGYFLHPPWKVPAVKPGSKATHRSFVEYRIQVADLAGMAFHAGVHMRKEAVGKSDGATFRVFARMPDGGLERFAALVNATAEPMPLVLDLGPFRGKAIVLRIEVDPGPAGNPAFDWAIWDAPIVECMGELPGVPSVVRFAGATLPGRWLVANGEVWANRGELHISLPNTIIAPMGEPAPISLPVAVTSLTYSLHTAALNGTEGADLLYRPAIEMATCGGIPRPSLHEHPPNQGRTLLDYHLRLPAQPAHLVGFVGIRDGAKSDGVGFRVEANGKEIYRKDLKPGSGWIPVNVDLAPWAGRETVLTLITDSLGEFNFDWAVWGDARLVPAARR